MTCDFCDDLPTVLSELAAVALAVPARPHLAPEDGGHLVVYPRRHVPDRRSLSVTETLAVSLLSFVAADAVNTVFEADWQNYQENGNWSLARGESPHMHLHVYGRSRASRTQPFGHALSFDDARGRASDDFTRPSPDQMIRLRRHTQLDSMRANYPDLLARATRNSLEGEES